MNKVGILYDNISGNTGDVAIGLSLKKILAQMGVAFDELTPGRFNPLDYETIIIGGGHLLRPAPDFFFDKFRVPGNHILNAMGIVDSPQDLDYLNNYRCITVRSTGDKKKLSYLNKEVRVIPCTSMLLDDIPDFSCSLKKPCIGIHLFPMFASQKEEDAFIQYIASLPFTVYFLPVTHYNRDIEYMRQLQARIPNAELLPILNAREIFTLTGRFDFLISCSLHGAIFAYSHNVPFVLYNNSDKMQFFMEDRRLQKYLFTDFFSLKESFERVRKEQPDYSQVFAEDRKVLEEYVEYLRTILPAGDPVGSSEDPDQYHHQISALLRDVSALEQNNRDRIRTTQILERKISDRESRIRSLMMENESLRRSISFKATSAFHKSVVRRFFRPHTRRRRLFDFGLNGGRILVQEGWKKGMGLIIKKISYNSRLWKSGIIPLDNPAGTSLVRSSLPEDTRVSVIIPTKNAGPGFEQVLEAIRKQERVPSIEIIVVDSGSTDKTPELAGKYQCRVFAIPPEDFNHGMTRNYGADQATGDFLLFMVQDAIPDGPGWLASILHIFQDHPDCGAVTCRQVLREDADLFAAYTTWCHYSFMEFSRDRLTKISPELFHSLNFQDRRKLAGLDDVCTCFRNDIFQRFRYKKQDFAEDLDIGLRMAEQGVPLAFLHSTSVIHSHTRDPEYYLRRCYADSKSIIEISGITPDPDSSDPDSRILSLYEAESSLKSSLACIRKQYPDSIGTRHFFSLLRGMFISPDTTAAMKPEMPVEDSMIAGIIGECQPGFREPEQDIFTFLPLIDSFAAFADRERRSFPARELADATEKLFSSYCGSVLGCLYYQHPGRYALKLADHLLGKGI